MKMKYLSSCRLTFLASTVFLANMTAFPTWSAEEDDQKMDPFPLSIKSTSLSNTKDVPSSYLMDVNKEEWENFINNLKSWVDVFFPEGVVFPADVEKIKSLSSIDKIKDKDKEQFILEKAKELNIVKNEGLKGLITKDIDTFYSHYSLLNTKRWHTTLQFLELERKKILSSFFNAVAGLEDILDELKTQDKTQKEGKNYHQIMSLFGTFQKVTNRFMKEWGIEKKPEQLGSLSYAAQYHAPWIQHLYYLRDGNGFIPFTIFKHEAIEEDKGLYKTYISYGQTPDLYQQRLVLFYSHDDKTIEIEPTPGLIVEAIGESLSLKPYTGATTPFLYTQTLSIYMGTKYSDLPPDLPFNEPCRITPSLIEQFKQPILKKNNIGAPLFAKTITSDESLSAKILEVFFRQYLCGKDKKFFPCFSSEIACLESNYFFLRNLQEEIKNDPQNEETLYTLSLVQQAFYGPSSEEKVNTPLSLEEIIEDHEKLLFEKYEEEIRLQQEVRSRMVADGYYDTESKHLKKSKNSKSKKGVKEKKKIASKIEHAQDEVAKKVRERLRELKEGKKYITYQKYLQLVNIVIQGFRLTGIEVNGYLNGSSHGAIVIGDHTIPHSRVHNGAMIPRTKAIAFCKDMLDLYFTIKWKNARRSTP